VRADGNRVEYERELRAAVGRVVDDKAPPLPVWPSRPLSAIGG
jgi:hypothetical protein